MWVISQARADEVVELAVREPDGILHRLERASPKIRRLSSKGESVGRATDVSGKRTRREFFTGRITARSVDLEGEPQGFIRGF